MCQVMHQELDHAKTTDSIVVPALKQALSEHLGVSRGLIEIVETSEIRVRPELFSSRQRIPGNSTFYTAPMQEGSAIIESARAPKSTHF